MLKIQILAFSRKTTPYAGYRRAIDSRMKKGKANGIGVRKKGSDPVKQGDEDIILDTGVFPLDKAKYYQPPCFIKSPKRSFETYCVCPVLLLFLLLFRLLLNIKLVHRVLKDGQKELYKALGYDRHAYLVVHPRLIFFHLRSKECEILHRIIWENS